MKNKIRFTLFLSIMMFFQSISLFAQQTPKTQIDNLKNNPAFYEVDPNSVSIEYLGDTNETDLTKGVYQPVGTNGLVYQDVNSVLDLLDNIVNLAKKIWDIVDDSKPVSNVYTTYATALPYGMSASQLSGWSSPRGYRYGFYVNNLYGITCVKVIYRVSFQYGGSYNGTGKYLTGVTVVPEVVDTLIGYSFYMSASVPDSSIVNIGTQANPIAALRLVLQWRISTILKDSQSTAVYYITGNGRFQQLSYPRRDAGKKNISGSSVVEEIVPTVVMPMPSVPSTNSLSVPENSMPAKLKKNIDKIF